MPGVWPKRSWIPSLGVLTSFPEDLNIEACVASLLGPSTCLRYHCRVTMPRTAAPRRWLHSLLYLLFLFAVSVPTAVPPHPGSLFVAARAALLRSSSAVSDSHKQRQRSHALSLLRALLPFPSIRTDAAILISVALLSPSSSPTTDLLSILRAASSSAGTGSRPPPGSSLPSPEEYLEGSKLLHEALAALPRGTPWHYCVADIIAPWRPTQAVRLLRAGLDQRLFGARPLRRVADITDRTALSKLIIVLLGSRLYDEAHQELAAARRRGDVSWTTPWQVPVGYDPDLSHAARAWYPVDAAGDVARQLELHYEDIIGEFTRMLGEGEGGHGGDDGSRGSGGDDNGRHESISRNGSTSDDRVDDSKSPTGSYSSSSGSGGNSLLKESPGDYLLTASGRWLELSLWRSDEDQWSKRGCALLPTVCAILREAAIVVGSVDGVGRIPNGAVSIKMLEPGARLLPHVGPHNARLTAHLALGPVPPGARMRVGEGSARTWEEGKVVVFDDSFVHEVWYDVDGHRGTHTSDDGDTHTSGGNTGYQHPNRYVLLFNVWHPELQPRAAIAASSKATCTTAAEGAGAGPGAGAGTISHFCADGG